MRTFGLNTPKSNNPMYGKTIISLSCITRGLGHPAARALAVAHTTWTGHAGMEGSNGKGQKEEGSSGKGHA